MPEMTRPEGIFVNDNEGYIFSEFFKTIAQEGGVELPPAVLEHPDNAANAYVQNYGLVIVMQNPDRSFVCFSSNYLNKLPMQFTSRVRSHFGLMPTGKVFWSDDVFKEPEEFPARQVIYGQKPEPPPPRAPKQTKEQVRRRWANPKLSQRELDYLKGERDEP